MFRKGIFMTLKKNLRGTAKTQSEDSKQEDEATSPPASRRTSPRGKKGNAAEQPPSTAKAPVVADTPSKQKKAPPKAKADNKNIAEDNDDDKKPTAVDTNTTNKKRALEDALPATKTNDDVKEEPLKKSKTTPSGPKESMVVNHPPATTTALNPIYFQFPSSPAFSALTPFVQASLLPKPPRVAHDFDVFFPKLVAFQQQYGHCRVPISYHDTNLNSFVKGVRRKFQKIQEWEAETKLKLDDHNSKFSLTKTQIEKLNAIGFDWTARRGRPKKEGKTKQEAKPNAAKTKK